MNKIGLIIAQHNEINYLAPCLQNWISYREHNPLLINVLDVCFTENGEGNSTDGSLRLLKQYKNDFKIDFLNILPPGLKEHEARNVALKQLLEQGCSLIVSIGSDEIFLLSDIQKIFEYVKKEEFIAVFKIPYKNYVFDKWHFVRGFAPHRIWRVNYNGYKLNQFEWDDDISYIKDDEQILDKQLPIKIIPNIEIAHFTWCDLERSIDKIKYQELHFKNGAGCSFRVNNGKIEFNPEYYKKTNQSFPEVYEENMNIFSSPYGKFILEPEDGVCRVIREQKFWDDWILPHLDTLSKDMVCIEAGSHIGFHTVYIAQKSKKVYAFEPQLINYDRLVKNIELNELTNVTCYNIALHNKEAKMAIENIKKQKDVDYGSRQSCSLMLYENSEADIEAKTIDSFNFEKIDFIKTDCENNDLNVLIGATETIKKYRPKIVFEYSIRDKKHYEFFEGLNYNLIEVIGQNFLATPK